MYVQAAMAAASIIQARSQRKKQVKAAVEDAKLQRAKLEQARTRQAGDLATNSQRLKESALKREIAIEHSRINAEAAVDATFAGSGISGTSLDEIDNEVNAQVAQNKHESKDALDASLSDQSRADRNQAEDINANANNIGAPVAGGGILDTLTTGISGFQKGASLVSGIKEATGTDINSSISNSLGIGNTTQQQSISNFNKFGNNITK